MFVASRRELLILLWEWLVNREIVQRLACFGLTWFDLAFQD